MSPLLIAGIISHYWTTIMIPTLRVLKIVVKGLLFTLFLVLFYILHMRRVIDQYAKVLYYVEKLYYNLQNKIKFLIGFDRV